MKNERADDPFDGQIRRLVCSARGAAPPALITDKCCCQKRPHPHRQVSAIIASVDDFCRCISIRRWRPLLL